MSVRWYPILDGFTYKPGVRLELGIDEDGWAVLRVRVDTIDSRKEGPVTIVHPTRVPEWVTDELQAKAFIRHCLREVELHEVDEWLRFDGELLSDPHAADVQPPAPVRSGGPTPADMPRRLGGPPPCNTPEKARYRSAAQAKRHHRDSYWSATHDEKPTLWPYLCPSGAHWHLTSLTPAEQADLPINNPSTPELEAKL